jgi:UDP-N-acetylglucosamine 4-epimerase
MTMRTYAEVAARIKASPSTWLVTGAAGFIGSNLVETLLKLDQNVVGLDNFSTGREQNLVQVQAAVGAEQWRRLRFIRGDIRSLETCKDACDGAQYVLHQAALGSVVRSIVDPIASHESNVSGFLNMLVAARDAKVAGFVYASSSAVYGDHPGLPKVESQIGRPLSPYGLTKYLDERYAEIFALCYEGFRTIGLRYFNVFGPRQDPDGAYAAVIPLWIAQMLRGQTVFINGDGSTTRDFCHIDNVVQANLLAATADDAAAVNQVYNVAVNEQTSLNELFATIRKSLVARFPAVAGREPVYREFRQGDVRYSRADITKARRLLGFNPAVRVAQGLAQAIDWYVADLGADEAALEADAAEPIGARVGSGNSADGREQAPAYAAAGSIGAAAITAR